MLTTHADARAIIAHVLTLMLTHVLIPTLYANAYAYAINSAHAYTETYASAHLVIFCWRL